MRGGDLGSGHGFEIVGALRQACDERLSSSLARLCGREEELLQSCVSTQVWILEDLRDARLLQEHDVMAAARGGSNENHPANE